MKFLLLIGGNHAAWDAMSPEDWAESEGMHGSLIAALRESGEFIECNELAVTADGARIIRSVDGATRWSDGPLYDAEDFASGYYLIECANLDRATEIAGQLYESRFAPIEVRRVGN